MSIDKDQCRCYDTASLLSKQSVYTQSQGSIPQQVRLIPMDSAQKAFRFILLIELVLMLGAPKMPEARAASSLFIVHNDSGQISTLIARGTGRIVERPGHSKAQQRLMAKRAAKLDAYQKLLQSSEWVKPHIERPDTIFQKDGFIQGASLLSEQIENNEIVTVELVLPITVRNLPLSEQAITEQTLIYHQPLSHTAMTPVTREEWQHFRY